MNLPDRPRMPRAPRSLVFDRVGWAGLGGRDDAVAVRFDIHSGLHDGRILPHLEHVGASINARLTRDAFARINRNLADFRHDR